MSVLPIGFGSSSGYNIDNSVRLRAAASAHFSKTFGSAGDRKTWTFHIRLKRGTLGSYQRILSDSTNNTYLRFDTNDRLDWNYYDGTSSNTNTSTRKFRDPTGWLDIVLSCDTTQGTSTNRWKIEVNGETLSAWDAGPSYTGTLNNAGCSINNNTAHYISGYAGTAEFFDGVVADIHFIGGARLSASDFGETNADGVWVPKPYAGSYSGTNSSHMDHADIAVTSGSNAGLGKDVSGNGNYWNTNSISVTSGVTYDALTDTPTNNYCTLNPLIYLPAGTIDYACLRYHRATTASFGTVGATFCLPTTGKWYWEVKPGLSVNASSIGVADISGNPQYPATGTEIGHRSALDYSYRSDGHKWSNNTDGGAYGATFANTNVIGVAWDSDAGTLTFFKDDTSQGTAYSSITQVAGKFVPASSNAENGGYDEFNFGQRPFANTTAWATLVSSGYKTLCTANMPSVAIKNPKAHFDAKTYTGTAGTMSVTGLGFQPDWTWVKNRAQVVSHFLTDALRGAGKRLYSDATSAEADESANFTAFTSDGFSIAGNNSGVSAAQNYISWNWKAGGTPSTDNVAGAGNTPTAGSVKIDGANLGSALAGTIAATRLSANTTAGFSIVAFNTGTAANISVAHGLSAVPAMIFIKTRGTGEWDVWHQSLTNKQDKFLILNSTNAEGTASRMWANTAPTSSVFWLESGYTMAASTNALAYCFAEIPGYSRFGSYVGNGVADGPFVWCGFRPKYVLIKCSSTTSHWTLIDAARSAYNITNEGLFTDTSGAEGTGAGMGAGYDFLSNGFKARLTVTNEENISGQTYIYAAFAEHPFGGGNVAPAPAR